MNGELTTGVCASTESPRPPILWGWGHRARDDCKYVTEEQGLFSWGGGREGKRRGERREEREEREGGEEGVRLGERREGEGVTK